MQQGVDDAKLGRESVEKSASCRSVPSRGVSLRPWNMASTSSPFKKNPARARGVVVPAFFDWVRLAL